MNSLFIGKIGGVSEKNIKKIIFDKVLINFFKP